MFYPAVLAAAILLPFQDSRPSVERQSRPAPQDEEKGVATKRMREGTLPPDFGTGAPGRAVIGQKWLPITNAPYCSAEQAKRRVRDKDLVIGIKMGDKAYCYPINMLGGPQREIINEEIDGEPFAINWWPLTFNGMVYVGKAKGKKVSLGVSGRLLDSNLLMWDEETNTLWSQIMGKALHGKLKGAQLELAPAVFVSFGTWKKIAPKTKVLDLSKVRATSWFYTTDDLARGTVGRGYRAKKLGIGLRFMGKTLLIPMARLHKEGMLRATLAGQALAIIWHEKEKAAFVYKASMGGKKLDLNFDGTTLSAGERSWNAMTGEPSDGEGDALPWFPYIPTYLSAWKSYYPKGARLK